MINLKRSLASLTALAILTAVTPAYAAEFSVTITPKTVIASSRLTAKTDPVMDDITYQWLTSEGENGPFTPIYKANDRQYVYSTIDKNRYITAEITDNITGETVRSADIRTAAKLGPVGAVTLQQSITPSENIFSVDGQRFILLDEFDNEASAYYVMAEGTYGEKEFDTAGNAVFDVQSENNIGYFLNNSFITDGNNGRKLPDSIIENIDRNHVWWTEAGMTDGDCEEDYSVTCGINLISMSESVKYQSVFGCAPDGADGSWWLRTQRGRGGVADNILCITGTESGTEHKRMSDSVCTDKKLLRPVFYLGNEFFKKVKLDISDTGVNIKELLKSKYTKAELEGLYSVEELVEIGFAADPGTVVKGAYTEIDTKTVQAGTTVTARMEVSGADEYRYQWLTGKTADGEYTEIRNAVDSEYYISTIDKNCYISCRITPVINGAEAEPDVTEPVFVETLGYVKERTMPEAAVSAGMITPEENKFALDGSERNYILLDSFNGDENAEFLVMADYLTGPIEADSDNPGIFDPEKKGNIAYWLNNNYKETGYEIAGIHKDGIESEFLKYVDMNHEWWCEAGIEGRNDTTVDYSYTGPFSVLSYSEGIKYYGVYGWQSATEHGGWNLHYWTRTSSDSADSFLCMHNSASMNDAAGSYTVKHLPAGAQHEEVAPRPVFYLSHDFFLKTNLAYVGDNVKKAIRQSYSIKEFVDAGYSIEKLKDLGWIDIPEVKNAEIIGAARVGGELSGMYDYIHTKPEENSVCGFEISDKREGPYKKIGEGRTYSVKSDDVNKFIRFYVQPRDVDTVQGVMEYTQPVYVLKQAEVIPLKAEILSGRGEKINSIANVSEIRPEVVLKNNSSSEKTVTVMLWLYDRNDAALDNRVKQVVIGAGQTVSVTDPILPIGKASNGSYARLYVIDNLSDMTSVLTGCTEVK